MPESLPPPPWRQTKPIRQPLSADLIVSTALEIMASDGLTAVSMRRIAQRLGAGTASLYAHVHNKAELHELMLDRVMSKLDVPEYDPSRWREQLKDLAKAMTQIMIDHPGIAHIAMHTLIPTSPQMLLSMDRTLGLLRAGGLPDKLVAYAGDAIALYTTAVAYEASLWSSKDGAAHEAQRRLAQLDEYLDYLPPHQLPHLRALRPLMAAEDAADHFNFALDLLIDGLDRHIPARATVNTPKQPSRADPVPKRRPAAGT